MASSIPNLNTLRTGRGGPRRRGARTTQGGDGASNEADAQDARDRVVQQTDNDASSSRMSATQLGYLNDEFAPLFWPAGVEVPKRYPIINRGTYVRTTAIDKLVSRFLKSHPEQKKQIISLGAGSDTRFFRFQDQGALGHGGLEYHELDFEANVNQKRNVLRSSAPLSDRLRKAEEDGNNYRLHALDLRDLIRKSPPSIPYLDPDLPTLLLSECCLCYLDPDAAGSVIQYFTMHIKGPVALVVYEPIRPFDAFGKTMVTNLASRGIHLQTLKRYSSLEAQRQRLRVAGFNTGQGARDVYELWESKVWVDEAERQRIEGLEWLDEVEEWQLLSRHYCVAWGWRGAFFDEAFGAMGGGETALEDKLDMSTVE